MLFEVMFDTHFVLKISSVEKIVVYVCRLRRKQKESVKRRRWRRTRQLNNDEIIKSNHHKIKKKEQHKSQKHFFGTWVLKIKRDESKDY